MRITSLICMMPILLLTISCGKGSKGDGAKYTKLTEEEIQDIMNYQFMDCAAINAGNPCPQGVSRLLTINKAAAEKSPVCSGFMVSKTQLVTNNHCVSTDEQCQNTHIAIFDGDSFPFITKCSKIVKTKKDSSNTNVRKIDFTVLEIEDSFEGETFSMSTTRADIGDTVTTWVIDHTGLDLPKKEANPWDSRVTQYDCKVAKQNETGSLVLDNCPMVHGNSGSVALNMSGEVVGVIWGGTSDYDTSKNLAQRRKDTENIGLATEMVYFAPYITP